MKTKMKIEEIEVSKIKDNPYQTRSVIEKEPLKVLTRSILKRGLINPISVLKDGENYIVISGHRRLKAYRNLKWKIIPAIVKDREKNKELIIDLVHENLVRVDLTPIEKAESLKLLFSEIKGTRGELERMFTLINSWKNYKRRGYVPEHKKERTQGFKDEDTFLLGDTLKSVGISENNAYSYLNLLRLPKYIQKEVAYKRQNGEWKEGISTRVAEQLSRIKDVEYQKAIFERAKRTDFTSAHIRALVDDYVQKVERGEWKGYSKKVLGAGKIKDSLKALEKLSDDCGIIAGRIASFRVTTLLKLEATLEKNLFVAKVKRLKNEIEVLRNLIDEKLNERGFRKIKKNYQFEIKLRNGRSSDKYERRFTFPTYATKEMNLPNSDILLKLKVIRVEKTNVKKGKRKSLY